jgi:hypothetical protein
MDEQHRVGLGRAREQAQIPERPADRLAGIVDGEGVGRREIHQHAGIADRDAGRIKPRRERLIVEAAAEIDIADGNAFDVETVGHADRSAG